MRPDVSQGTNLCRGVDYCAGMDALGVLLTEPDLEWSG
jgi:hypothetical protein